MRFRALSIFAVTVISAAPLAAQSTPADTAAVTVVVQSYHGALRTGDTALASRLIADDALMLEAGGVETRAEYLANHLPLDIQFEKTATTVRSPLRVIVAGDTAWATSTSEMSGTFQNRPVNSIGAELMVLTRNAAGWSIRAIHWSGRAKPPAR
jgi:ketosteroid isomerase-like protein